MERTTILTIATLLLVLSIETTLSTIKDHIRKDAEDYYKDKPDNCSAEAIGQFVGGKVTPNADIQKICVNVVKPCCSFADIQAHAENMKRVDTEIGKLQNWMVQFYSYLGSAAPELYEKISDVDAREKFKSNIAVVKNMESEIRTYLSAVNMFIMGFGCVSCDAKHGSDFKFENGVLKEIVVQPTQCHEILSVNLKLFTPLRQLRLVTDVIKPFRDSRAAEFTFDFEGYVNQITSDENAISECRKQFSDNSADPKNVTQNCIDLCKNLTPIQDYRIPYNFQALAFDISKIIKLETGNTSTKVEPPNFEQNIKISSSKNEQRDFTLTLDRLGMNVTNNFMDPKEAKLSVVEEDTQFTNKDEPVRLVESEANSTGAMIAVAAIVLGSLGATVGVVYWQTK